MIRFSIITITYNSAATLQHTIDSVRQQKSDYYYLEYIVIDGGSKDGTLDIIQNNSDIISKWVSEPDEGISDAFNKGIKMASGDIIGIINSDDMYLDNALLCVYQEYDEGIDVYFGHGETISGKGEIKPFYSDTNLKSLYKNMKILHPSVFITKRAYEKYGLFDKKYLCVMDRELLLRFYHKGAEFKVVDQKLSRYRFGGVSHRKYFSIVLKEDKNISISYGMNQIHASFYYLMKRLYMHVLFWIKEKRNEL